MHRDAASRWLFLVGTTSDFRCWLVANPRVTATQDPECQYHAAIALRKLAPNLSSHEAIVTSDGIKSLFHLTAMKDIKLRRQAAVALRDLASNPDHKEVSAPVSRVSVVARAVCVRVGLCVCARACVVSVWCVVL